jgi:hypothetical protein
MDELIRRVMELGKLELQMCELVNFAQKQIAYALGYDFEKSDIKSYASYVLGEFKKISPNAKLIIGNKVPKDCFNYVQVTLDNVWVFAIDKPEFMMVEVKTDGSIHLDWGTAEQIFNFVSD